MVNNKSDEPINIFISYPTKDKKIAGEIKRGLELLGFVCFLAHEDIKAGEWREYIDASLNTMEVFLPLLTKAAKNSAWVNQESGIAHYIKKAKVRKISIVPLRKSYDPQGCLSIYQAHQLRFKAPGVLNLELRDIVGLAKKFVKEIQGEERARKFSIPNLRSASAERAILILEFVFLTDIQYEDAETIFEFATKNTNMINSEQVYHYLSAIYNRFKQYAILNGPMQLHWEKYGQAIRRRREQERLEDEKQELIFNKILKYAKVKEDLLKNKKTVKKLKKATKIFKIKLSEHAKKGRRRTRS
jgi:hypothetical protein